jgi:hypothetical protein
MTLSRKHVEGSPVETSADRRQFLRNSLKIGAAAALLFSSSARQMLAESLVLSEHELDAARRARQTPAAPGTAEPVVSTRSNDPSGGCIDCSGSCFGSCSGGCLSGCQGSCLGQCLASCQGSCVGRCSGSCMATCSGGCMGSCLGVMR